MVLLYEKYFDWEEKTSKTKVSAKELSELIKIMSNDDNELLNEIFSFSGIVKIAESCKMCLELLITLCKQKADYFKVELNEDFILYIERFLNSEIMRYIKNCSRKIVHRIRNCSPSWC